MLEKDRLVSALEMKFGKDPENGVVYIIIPPFPEMDTETKAGSEANTSSVPFMLPVVYMLNDFSRVSCAIEAGKAPVRPPSFRDIDSSQPRLPSVAGNVPTSPVE
jgi:hypothetical protein